MPKHSITSFARRTLFGVLDSFVRRTAALALIGLAACGTVSVEPLGKVGENFRTSPEEAKLLARASAAHSEMVAKGLFLEDQSVVAYIRKIGDALVPADISSRAPIRFHVLRSPVSNAMALPCGDIYVTVGYLARLENEAQLAFVLAHEIAHVTRRHAYAADQERTAGWIGVQVADIFLLGTKLAYFPYMASLASYSRERELEADNDGLATMAAAGYAPEEARLALKRVTESKADQAGTSWQATHPPIDERTNRLADQQPEKSSGAEARVGAEAYRPIRIAVSMEAIDLNLRARRYRMAAELARQALDQNPAWAMAHYYLGESLRLATEDPSGAAKEQAWLDGVRFGKEMTRTFHQEKHRNLQEAIAAFESAKKSDPELAVADKGLGLSYVSLGEKKKGIELLKSFIARYPTDRENLYLRRIIERGDQ